MIFVDGLEARRAIWGDDQVAHLVSDTSVGELKAFAERLGLPLYWLQMFPVPHYELSEAWRRRALKAGAEDCAGDRAEQYRCALRRYLDRNLSVPVRAPGRPRRG